MVVHLLKRLLKYTHLSYFYFHTSTPLHLRVKYYTFYSTTYI